jgi:hypothetical protein
MPNALVGPMSQGQPITCPLYHPDRAIAYRRRFGRHPMRGLDLANSLYVAAGRYPARGWILLKRSDYNRINPYATNLQLQIEDTQKNTPGITFMGLTVVQAQCVSRGIASDPNAIYLVELTDARGWLCNEWFYQSTGSEYNIRAPAYPQMYYTASLTAGMPWTWSAMIGNLWGQLTPLGAYPGLPITPTQDVEGWALPGCEGLSSLCDMIEQVGCSLAVDLTMTAPYSIIVPGAPDPAFTALTSMWSGALEDDLEYIDVGSGRVPARVLVYFHRRNDYYGTEETIRMDALQWTSTPFFTVMVPAPAPFAAFGAAAGTGTLWCEFTVRFDINNVPLPADVTMAMSIAAERVGQYYRTISRGTLGFMHQVYSGTIPFAVGSQADGVCWHMDGQDGRAGWTTECVRGPNPAWGEVVPLPRRGGW